MARPGVQRHTLEKYPEMGSWGKQSLYTVQFHLISSNRISRIATGSVAGLSTVLQVCVRSVTDGELESPYNY